MCVLPNMELYHCFITVFLQNTGRKSKAKCVCMDDNLPCTTMCMCEGCTNSTEDMLKEESTDCSNSDDDDDESDLEP